MPACSKSWGVDYVEGGYPGANPVDTEFFETRRTKKARFTAFGMTKRAGRSAANDPGVQALLNSQADATCFVAKTWDHQVRIALEISLEENLENLRDTVAAAVAAGKEALIDCEHFFDGFKANPDYALACVKTALEAGARWVVLCDTNGGTMPSEVRDIVDKVLAVAPGDHLGIHAHDDTGQAVANTLAAVEAGVRQIQGTLNGIGERCGNANLITIIPTLVLKPHFAERFQTGIDAAHLERLTQISRAFDDRLNRAPARQAPYVGASAFATKAGIHASALLKDFSTYEHVPPESVGNERSIMVSQQAGKSNLLTALARHGINLSKDDRRLEKLLATVKDRESRGYSYDGADASFAVLAHEVLGTLPNYFHVENYRASVERRHNAPGRGDHGHRGSGQNPRRGRAADVGGRGQWPGQCARSGHAQRSRQVFGPYRGSRTGRFQGPYSGRRHGRGHPCTGRKPRWHRRALVHDRGFAQHH